MSFLVQQRYVLRLTAYGLSDEQGRATPARSPLSIGGIVKHLSSVEEFWTGLVVQRAAPASRSEDDYDSNFRLGQTERLQEVLDRYQEVARNTDQVIHGISDLGQRVPIPRDVPWFPKDVDAWSVRWVLLHLIQETARHAGHADIVREEIDGATAFPLMAAAEGWPESPWLKPWDPDMEAG